MYPGSHSEGEFISTVLKKAGREVMRFWRSPADKEFAKTSGRFDFYSLADTASEKIIVTSIKERFPSYRVLSEESAEQPGATEFTWVIDPLDGSIPFRLGQPTFGISVGLVDGSRTRLGSIHLPVSGETIIAGQDQGTCVNKKRVCLLGKDDQSKAVVGVDYSKKRDADEVRKTTGALIEKFRYVVTYGSTAYAVASVILGTLDAFVHPAPDRFDMGGIDLLVSQAGGVITNFDGDPIDRTVQNSIVVSSNKRIHDAILSALNN